MGTVLYELHFSRPAMSILGMLGSLAFLLFCTWAMVSTVRDVLEKKCKKHSLIGAGGLMLFGAIVFWPLWISPVTDYLALRAVYESGNVEVAEGNVTAYSSQRLENGIWYESFSVNGVRFRYDSWDDFPGYALRGGIFSKKQSVISGDGQHLRITDVPDWPNQNGTINSIVRIEELFE